MANSAALQQLRDIHLPTPISWWPPAPGWIILSILVLILVFSLLLFLSNYLQRQRTKSHALHLLKRYRADYDANGEGNKACAQLSELLKRVALAYFPRETVAGLSEEAWINFLNETGKVNFNSVRLALLDGAYQPQVQAEIVLPLFQQVEHWIKQRGKRCLN